MIASLRLLALAGMAATLGLGASPAVADGKVRCGGGPREQWRPLADLKKQVWQAGWELIKAHPEKDCYEVYARTAEGQSVEAFFHPVTLEKLVVYRRGREIYRKPGFGG